MAGPFLKNKSSLGYKQNSKQDFYEAITKSLENEQKLQEFHETDNLINPNSSRYLEYGDYLKIDDHHKWWYTAHGKPGSVVFKFSDIVDFEISENGHTIAETKTKGGSGVGRAVVGGALFGPAGALVGATTKKKKATTTEKQVLDSMCVRIFLDNNEFTMVTIDGHDRMRSDAEGIISRLRKMKINSSLNEESTENSSSVADEILKFKQLLDIGAITQEEFEAKKKQLLKLF